MSQREKDLLAQVHKLAGIGIALSAEQDLDALLNLIVREARHFYRCDAGSLYIVEESELVFRVAQNETLSRRRRERGEEEEPFREKRLPLTRDSIAGHVAITGQLLAIDDVYILPEDVGYTVDLTWDKANNYRCKSMLLIPLRSHTEKVVGVLQLINSLDDQGEPRPFDATQRDLAESLASQAAVALTNVRLMGSMRRATMDTIFRLSMAAEYKDPDTAAHLERMSRYSEVLARGAGMPDRWVELIRYASPMHDIGKIGVPDKILMKPGKLTHAEFDEMKNHTLIGARILEGSDSELLQLSERVALAHHEKFDGSGYPHGQKGEEIPIEGRIVAVADVFDALTTKRCYKPAFSVEKALGILREGDGKHFDPQILAAFMANLDEILDIRSRLPD